MTHFGGENFVKMTSLSFQCRVSIGGCRCRGASLQWRHNGCDCVSNHQPHDCLLNRLFRHRSKKTSKLRVTGLCVGNSPGTGKFPAQMAGYAENVSIWWRHHSMSCRLFPRRLNGDDAAAYQEWPNVLYSLKRKYRHFDDILINHCTRSCRFNNFRCSQWCKFHYNGNSSVSVLQ